LQATVAAINAIPGPAHASATAEPRVSGSSAVPSAHPSTIARIWVRPGSRHQVRSSLRTTAAVRPANNGPTATGAWLLPRIVGRPWPNDPRVRLHPSNSRPISAIMATRRPTAAHHRPLWADWTATTPHPDGIARTTVEYPDGKPVVSTPE
jgi:hypothetical protein